MTLTLNTEGYNRFVILTRRHAIKIPSLRSWRDFLFGLLNNMHEAQAQRSEPFYCPVLWAAPLGLAIVMPRVRVLTDQEWPAVTLPAGGCAEHKPSSWGWLGDRLVAIDYGWPTYGWPA